MTDDAYNGWTNRETWALQLWLESDQGLHETTRERVADAVPAKYLSLVTRLEAARTAGEAVKSLWDEITDLDEGLMAAEYILSMVRDVGSEYRVNWDEIGAHWLEDVTDNPVGES